MSSGLKQNIYNYCIGNLALDDCRFADIPTPYDSSLYARWIQKGYHGEMKYLEKHSFIKEDLNRLLPGIRSAIVIIKSYNNTREKHLPQRYKIARYAAGKDYHIVLSEITKKIEAFIHKHAPDIRCYSGIDSRPIPERNLALRAGIGFRGKNTMVIKPGLGSYFFIAVILTTYGFEPDTPVKKNCGSCRLCIDACPAGAITDDLEVDARKCISYSTIERKTSLSTGELEDLRGWMFGCDLCQEACPYNHGNIPLTKCKTFCPGSGMGFSFFDSLFDKKEAHFDIPKDSAMYRSRKHVQETWKTLIVSKYDGVKKDGKHL